MKHISSSWHPSGRSHADLFN